MFEKKIGLGDPGCERRDLAGPRWLYTEETILILFSAPLLSLRFQSKEDGQTGRFLTLTIPLKLDFLSRAW